MKYNLKNRPQPIDGCYSLDELKYKRWFEGFTKELKERHQTLLDAGFQAQITIKEILGE